MDIYTLGQMVAQARIRAGLTQAELAALAALSKTTISRLERGVIADLGVRKLLSVLDCVKLELQVLPVTRPTLAELQHRSRPTDTTTAPASARRVRHRKMVGA